MEKKPRSNRDPLMQYSALAFQLFAAIGLAVYAGFYLDRLIKTNFPIFLWLLPLIVIIALIIKVVQETSNKK